MYRPVLNLKVNLIRYNLFYTYSTKSLSNYLKLKPRFDKKIFEKSYSAFSDKITDQSRFELNRVFPLTCIFKARR